MEKDQHYLITTVRLGLRRWRRGDLEPFTQMNQDPVVMEYFPRLMTAAETSGMVERIDAFFDQHGYGLYAVELRSTGEFLGYTGFAQPSFESWFTPCVEIGWRLKKEAWGQGYATEAAGACLGYGFSTLGLTKVLSFTAVVNIRSERVMQKIGMTRVGGFEHPLIAAEDMLRSHVLYEVGVAARTV